MENHRFYGFTLGYKHFHIFYIDDHIDVESPWFPIRKMSCKNGGCSTSWCWFRGESLIPMCHSPAPPTGPKTYLLYTSGWSHSSSEICFQPMGQWMIPLNMNTYGVMGQFQYCFNIYIYIFHIWLCLKMFIQSVQNWFQTSSHKSENSERQFLPIMMYPYFPYENIWKYLALSRVELQPFQPPDHWTPGHMKCSELLGLFVASDHRDLRRMSVDFTIMESLAKHLGLSYDYMA